MPLQVRAQVTRRANTMQRPTEHFGQRLASAVRRTRAPVCVGLDPHPGRLPSQLGDGADAAQAFCEGVIDAVADLVPVVKPQSAFFEAMGWRGVRALEQVVRHARARGLIVILDAKRGDIGSTARAYASCTIPEDGADSVTLSPYLGPESLSPFLQRPDKGAFVLVRTSNPGAGPWQTETGVASRVAGWVEDVAKRTSGEAGLGNVGAVVAATVPEETDHWRQAMPHAWFLVPGFGAQGGTTETVDALFREDGLGAVVNSSRGVLFPPTGTDGGDWQDRVRERAAGLVQAFSGRVTSPGA